MRSLRNPLIHLALVLTLAALPGTASATLHLLLDASGSSQGPIPGDSTVPGFQNLINVSSFSHGVSTPAGLNGQPAGPPSVSDLNITTGFDRATVRLFQALALEESFSNLRLLLVEDAPQKMPMVVLRFDLSGAYVTSAQESGADGLLPTVAFSFSYYSITITDLIEGTSVTYNYSPSAASLPETASKGILLPATPNPTRGSTEFRFSLPGDSNAELTLFDLRGHLIRRLHSGWTPAEGAVAVWNGDDAGGNKVPQGVYMARLTYPGHEITQRITLLR